MNIVLLYLLLLKGTVTAFAGLASLPVIQESLVNHYHVLTNEQLNEAVVITRSSPGPVGLYIVSVGYFAAGLPGAIAGWLAMITPALLIIPLVHFVGRRSTRACDPYCRPLSSRAPAYCWQPQFPSDGTA
jgi:chromate transporter